MFIISDFVSIEGPCYIGKKSEIRHSSYIRKGSWICDGAVVGNSTEIKNSLLLPGAKAAHFNYVGDSILGYNVNLGAGTKLSNVRNDEKSIRVNIKNKEYVDTCLFKLGSIIHEDLVKANTELHNHLKLSNVNFQQNHDPNSLYCVLAQAYVGTASTKVIIDKDPRDDDIKLNSDENNDVYYLNGKQSDQNKKISTYHWFLIRDNSKFVFNYLVTFTLDPDVPKCFTTGCTNNTQDMKYCHNDQKYF